MYSLRRIALVALALMYVGNSFAMKPNTMNREEISDDYKWDLSAIYDDEARWANDRAQIDEMMAKYEGFKGHLGDSPEKLAELMLLNDELGMFVERWASYIWLKQVVDQKNQELQGKVQEMSIMFARFGQATSWINPEIIASINEATMKQWIASNDVLKEREFGLMELYRLQDHVLDAEQENLLAMASQTQSVPGNTRSALATADVKFPEVTLSDGETITATHGAYAAAKETYRNQDDRMAVFQAHFSTFDDFENTYAAIVNGMLQANWFETQARKYESTAQRYLASDDIPVDVMAGIIQTAKDGAEPLQRYNKIRKEVMGLEKYRYFDMYVPLVDIDWPFYYDDLKPIILESLEPFGKEYVNKATRAFDERWFDVYENEGKRSGAFSSGVYGVHPYMMLNHADTMNDAFTLAHELGHTMHTVLSDETQPYHSKDYTIFVAEIASTMNEQFFLEELLKRTDDPDKRIALLEHAINSIHGTFYRQLLFADFEYKMHTAVQNGQPITAATLQDMYLTSLNDFFGDSLDDQELYKNTWARIPHFMRPFYVYQYATSIAASSQFYDMATNEDKYSKKERKEALDRYLTLLKSGGNDHPIVQCQTAGVDFMTPQPGEAMVAKMDRLVTQLEKELKKKGMLKG